VNGNDIIPAPAMVPPAESIVALLAVHNRLQLTQRCLAALRVASPQRRLHCVVVDDGSTDGTAVWLAGQPDVSVIRGDGNLWFGGATDLGLRHVLVHQAEFSHVLVLNNDTFVYPQALDLMVGAARGNAVVSAAYWVEDRQVAGSAGFHWENWWGLRDVSLSRRWLSQHEAQQADFIPVDAVATTLTLVPMDLLRRSRLPDPRLHPHNRYDAILSARMRAAGACFLCSTAYLAGHLYGPLAQRPSARTMRLARFWHESFTDRRSIFHLSGNCAQIMETAPDPAQKIWALLRQLVRFGRQLAWVSLNSLRPQRSPVVRTAS
jgi:GT2 family glycosyltransferase